MALVPHQGQSGPGDPVPSRSHRKARHTQERRAQRAADGSTCRLPPPFIRICQGGDLEGYLGGDGLLSGRNLAGEAAKPACEAPWCLLPPPGRERWGSLGPPGHNLSLHS